MDAYIFVVIWGLSVGVCLWIGKVRHIRPNFFWNSLVAILGPLAIPFLLLARPGSAAKDG
jgi:hypothetical protein